MMMTMVCVCVFNDYDLGVYIYIFVCVYLQMQFIDALDGDDLLLTGEVKWRPLVEDNAQSILKVASPTYNDAGL